MSAPPPDAPFHAGERAVQERVGVRDRIEAIGQRVIRSFMPEQHRELFGKLPWFFVGSLDAQRRPWASVLAGRPGFVSAPDERTLRIAAVPSSADPLAQALRPGVPLGLLGLEPHTRRRNRMNGTVSDIDADGFTVAVDQSFGNCPQYIQAREPQWARPPDTAEPAAESLGAALHDAAIRLVRAADTLFIASAAARARGHGGADGVDVSHRGGNPGFVRVDSDGSNGTVLTLPDFRGNFLFNTLGNIAAHPQSGLLFIDHASGDLLQLTGRAEIVWGGPEVQAFEGAQRLLRVRVDEAVWRPEALPLRWSAPQFAPQLATTGRWR
ncbi:pyridoxamine 5'-phosphate oxidase family protein [Piscinibacter sp. XHJ-5]|uniref:pyridoxamine 5'-phosphate oxidase family protein n=1 Tax=Piscinibacter sp. XHJ-5 TaxID=3037797 RepID=UPI002452AEC5|nr:pyridoxamine 5'-phosphate oxidase family protein [Piscinibacter sp. XHJ-5]